MRRTLWLFLIVILGLSVSCKKSLDPGKTLAEKTAGGWWVTLTTGGVDVFNLGTFFLATYNTSAGDDSLWVDDLGHAWNFKCKAKADFANRSFSVSNAQNQYYNSQVTIMNGKVLPKGGKSRAGNITDSIYFQVQFSDDTPVARTWVISGTARTSFIEDDY